MMVSIPLLILASSLVGNERNSILFVGYCDPDTPGGNFLVAIEKATLNSRKLIELKSSRQRSLSLT